MCLLRMDLCRRLDQLQSLCQVLRRLHKKLSPLERMFMEI